MKKLKIYRKPDVELAGHPIFKEVREVVAGVYNARDFDCVVTSGKEQTGKKQSNGTIKLWHQAHSAHYCGPGCAEDYRTKHLPSLEVKREIEREIMSRLKGLKVGTFYVALENIGKPHEHIHVQYNYFGSEVEE